MGERVHGKLMLTDDEAKHGCGIGQGTRCCKYLLAGLDDLTFECGRESGLRQKIIDAKGWTAARLPEEPYPLCQLPHQGYSYMSQ